jgi:LmbE family N-acetylglucosaminyl deacetylase
MRSTRATSLASRENLAEVREREERAALVAAGMPEADLRFLRYPDGHLAEAPRNELVEAVAKALREARPQVVATFGPEGITKHEDHVAIGQATTEAFHLLQAEAGADAFQRLVYTSLPQSSLDRFRQVLRDRGVDIGDPEGPFMPRGVPDHTIGIRTDCRSVVDRKLEAIRAHRTQQVELDYLPEDLRPELLGEECFVQAWPPVTDPAGPIAAGIFEGLGD